MAYKKAPFHDIAWPVIEEVLSIKTQKVSEQAIYSVEKISEYLGINTIFERSSEKYSETRGHDKTLRLLEISRINRANTYINPIGGQDLYNKEEFRQNNIELQFLKPQVVVYKQYTNSFISELSILDVMMFNSVVEIRNMLNNYELI